MQFSSSGSVVSPSRRPTPASCWARARQLGGRPANAARTLSVRWKSGGEAEGGVGVLASRALFVVFCFLAGGATFFLAGGATCFLAFGAPHSFLDGEPGPQGALQGFFVTTYPC